MECPVLKIDCPKVMTKKRFWAGAVSGADGQASMAKCLAWAMFVLIAAYSFCFPDRHIVEFLILFNSLLAYIFGGKWTGIKHGLKTLAESGEEDNDDREAQTL